MPINKIFDILGIIIVCLFFVVGIYILASSHFNYLPTTIRVIFSIILFLYGIYMLTRIIYKQRNKEDEE